MRPGHTLVVPRQEIAAWTDLSPDALSALWATSATVARAIDAAFRPTRVAALLAGLEVPHVHVHLVPIDAEAEIDFRRADPDPDPKDLDAAADRIRAALG